MAKKGTVMVDGGLKGGVQYLNSILQRSSGRGDHMQEKTKGMSGTKQAMMPTKVAPTPKGKGGGKNA